MSSPCVSKREQVWGPKSPISVPFLSSQKAVCVCACVFPHLCLHQSNIRMLDMHHKPNLVKKHSNSPNHFIPTEPILAPCPQASIFSYFRCSFMGLPLSE